MDKWNINVFSTSPDLYESENEVESENHPKSYICGRILTFFEGFLEIAGTSMSGLIAQFSKYDFWNLWEIWDRNM